MGHRKENEKGRGVSRRSFLQQTAAAVGGMALVRVASGDAAYARPAGALPAGSRRRAQNVINVMDHGAKGDGSTNDFAAFQAAINAAIAAKQPLWVPRPPQFYRIILDPSHDRLLVDGDLAISGEGRDAVTLRFTVQTNASDKNYAAIFVAGAVNCRLSDLRLEEDLHQPEEQFEFMGVHFQSSGVSAACVVERVDIDGFTHCLYCPTSGIDGSKGELFLTVRDCDLKPWWQYTIAFWTVAGGHKRLHIYDSYLHDNQHSHLIYCHPHNSVHVENTRFNGATGWAFQFQGTEVAGDPEYQRFIGCWFGPGNVQSLITQDRATVTTQVEIRNCTFEGQPAIQIRSDVLIDGCYFTTPPDSVTTTAFIGAYTNAPWKATIRNCIFAPRVDLLPQVDLRLENIEVDIENCQFYNQRSGTMLSLGGGAANRYTVRDCLFYNRPDNASESISVEIDNGQTAIDHCRFFGRSVENRGTITLRSTDTGPAADSFVQIDNSTFQSNSGGALFYVLMPTANSWSGKFGGANNRILDLQTGKPLLMTSSSTPIYGRLTPMAAPAPTSLPAGATLVISSNYDTYDLLGGADVANIHWWTADGLSNPLFTGTITLTASVPFALVGGGNIRLAGGAARRDVGAGTSIRLTYDPAQGFWSEG